MGQWTRKTGRSKTAFSITFIVNSRLTNRVAPTDNSKPNPSTRQSRICSVRLQPNPFLQQSRICSHRPAESDNSAKPDLFPACKPNPSTQQSRICFYRAAESLPTWKPNPLRPGQPNLFLQRSRIRPHREAESHNTGQPNLSSQVSRICSVLVVTLPNWISDSDSECEIEFGKRYRKKVSESEVVI